MTIDSLVLHQLHILRGQVELLIAMVEGGSEVVTDSGKCPHPEDQRQDLRTLGDTTPRFRCLRCDATVDGIA